MSQRSKDYKVRKRIAFVNQRYGLEVNGGSELYTRQIVEKLSDEYDITVLTTKALDYVTWENYYAEEEESINGVRVKRFSVEKPRDINRFGNINQGILLNHARSLADEKKWVREQGPYCPELVEYIEDNAGNYELFIFVTYLYYTTCMGMRPVFDKSIFIPTAHDEPYIHFSFYRDLFTNPKGIIYLTDEERELVQTIFHNEEIPNIVTAVGIDIPQGYDADEYKREIMDIAGNGDFLCYMGRIDESKGCGELFDFFIKYKKENHSSLRLVLMGRKAMEIPEHPDIIYLGFVSDNEKFYFAENAVASILPSALESLSLSVLESFSVGTPVIINGDSKVLKGHCLKSNAGLYYTDYYEFAGCLDYLLSHGEAYSIMKDNARRYIDRHYCWDVVKGNIISFFEMIMSEN